MSYKFWWNLLDSGGLQWTCLVEKSSPNPGESAGTWHILADYTGLDLPIWPVWHWKSLGDRSCGFQQIPVESDGIRQIVWGSVQSSIQVLAFPNKVSWALQKRHRETYSPKKQNQCTCPETVIVPSHILWSGANGSGCTTGIFRDII